MGGKKTITKCQLQDTKLWWEVADTGRGYIWLFWVYLGQRKSSGCLCVSVPQSDKMTQRAYECSSEQTGCICESVWKNRIHQQGSKHACDLAPSQQHQNIGHKWATEYTMTQCNTAVPLPCMTSCTPWVWTSSLGPCGSFLFCVSDRKWQINLRGNKDILIVQPIQGLMPHINTDIQYMHDTDYWFLSWLHTDCQWCQHVSFTFEFGFMKCDIQILPDYHLSEQQIQNVRNYFGCLMP